MKTIGLIGGMSWESTAEYYRIINQAVRERLGGLHSASILLYSFDFEEIEPLQRQERWLDAGLRIAAVAGSLAKAGADLLLLCTNTMHKVAEMIEDFADSPFLHIADATGAEVVRAGLKTVGLLGTRYTMEEDFYRGRLETGHGVKVLIPEEADRQAVNDIIFNELCRGKILEASRERMKDLIATLAARGAEGVILGCTEIPLLVRQEDVSVPLFDTTRIHALCAVELALAGEEKDQ